MKIAIISNLKPSFPGVLTEGLYNKLISIGYDVEKIDALPFLMRSLPICEIPHRYKARLHYRVREKLKYFVQDCRFINKLKSFDLIIITECYANLFWKNYYYIEILKKKTSAKIVSYTDAPLDAAPLNKARWINKSDYSELRFDKNLFLTNKIEVYYPNIENQFTIGVFLSTIIPTQSIVKKSFIAVVDFPQHGYEKYRDEQLEVLKLLGITTIVLNEPLPRKEIIDIYTKASVFFISSPETFGLAIAECLSLGTIIITPSSSWPMAWRLCSSNEFNKEEELVNGCFEVYSNRDELILLLNNFSTSINFNNIAEGVKNKFIAHYPAFYYGNEVELNSFLHEIEESMR